MKGLSGPVKLAQGVFAGDMDNIITTIAVINGIGPLNPIRAGIFNLICEKC